MVKVLGVGTLALAVSVEVIGQVIRRLWSGGTLNEVLFFPSEVACAEHIFCPALPQ